VPGAVVNGSVIGNINPSGDDCAGGAKVQMGSRTIGDLLTARGISWGWFYDGWAPVGTKGSAAVCRDDYNPHYAPFQYYASTLNPHHLPPSSVAAIGHTDQAKHQYDVTDFWNALAHGSLPAVSFIKPRVNSTGHPDDSDPLLEQHFLVETLNRLERSRDWSTMAVLITYDDSDGWYDHVMPPIMSPSNDPANDALLGPGKLCGTPATGAYLNRCGYGPRLPFLVISPFAKSNYVSRTTADQSSIIRFIEDNWGLGRLGDQSFDAMAGSVLDLFRFDGARTAPLFLNPDTGEPVR
jgi:phospholipase C